MDRLSNFEILRNFIPSDSPTITSAELNELSTIINIDNIDEEFDYAGSFILTKDVADRDEAVCSMCCGIYTEDIKLSNGEMVYFAFDYGH